MTATGVKWQCFGLVSMETTNLSVRLDPGGDPAFGHLSGHGGGISDQEAICIFFTHNPPLMQCCCSPRPSPHEEPALQTEQEVRNLICPTKNKCLSLIIFILLFLFGFYNCHEYYTDVVIQGPKISQTKFNKSITEQKIMTFIRGNPPKHRMIKMNSY